MVKTDNPALFNDYTDIISHLGSLSELTFADSGPAGAVSFVVGGSEFFIPLEGHIDLAAEREKLEKELEYTWGFHAATEKKLANEKFVANAKPELVERERQKLADAETKIAAAEGGAEEFVESSPTDFLSSQPQAFSYKPQA